MGKRDDRLKSEREQLRRLIEEGGLKETVLEAWCERTGRRQRSFYERLAELDLTFRRRYERLPDGRTIDRQVYMKALAESKDLIAKSAYMRSRDDMGPREQEKLWRFSRQWTEFATSKYPREILDALPAPIRERFQLQ